MIPTKELTPEIVADRLEGELAIIQAKVVTVVDLPSHDATIAEIRNTKAFVDKVEVEFQPILSPLQEALDAVKALKKRIVDPANEWMKQKRQECATWQTVETKRLEVEHKKALEVVNNLESWEEKPAAVPVLAKPSTSGAGLRNKPWGIVIENEDAFWEAAAKDPRLHAYRMLNLPALKAAARSRGGMLNIPGIRAVREQTLSLRK